MKGFLFYMILGGIITIYRMHFQKVDQNDSWYNSRNRILAKMEEWSIFVNTIVFLFLSLVGLPVLLTDYTLFFIGRIKMMKYNSPAVKMDVYQYIQLGILHGEAVSYSMTSRFNSEEIAEIENSFKEAEARIIKHGFIPFKVGNFVEFYQDGAALPKMRIKGKRYNN